MMLPQNLRSHGPNINRDTFGRRVTKACARCRKRKIKCDLQFPTCGSCALVKAECLGFDAAQGKSRPRSTISHLENQIAQLEIELAQLKYKHASTTSFAFSSAVNDLTTRLAHTIAEPWKDNSNSTFEGSDVLPLASPTFLSQSPLPKFNNNIGDNFKGNDDSENIYQSTNIASIPRNVIDIMVKNYCETYLPQYPALEEDTLYDSCNRIYLNDGPDHWDFFTVAITLAISANTLIRHDEKRAIAAAGEFWATAKEHLPFIGLGNTWQRLQALQLLAHYGLLNPRLVNCSNCASAATRLCIQLGLHRELAANEQERLGISIVNTRRRLFWTSYSLDAAFHSVLCQPYIWPKTSITTLFPSSPSTPTSPTSHVWSLRQIEAEVTLKMYFPSIIPSPSSTTAPSPQIHPDPAQSSSSTPSQPPSSPSFQTWFHTTSHTLHDLRSKTTKSGLADVLDLQTFRLNRPSPRYPNPSPSMRRNAITAAITLTKEYAAMERAGKFFYIWYAAHYLMELWVWVVEGVVVGLEGMRAHEGDDADVEASSFLGAFEPAQLTHTLHTFPLLLRKVAHRWPAIQPLAWELEEISTPLLQKLEECSLREVAASMDFTAINQRLALFSAVPAAGQRGHREQEREIDAPGLRAQQENVAMSGTRGVDVESWVAGLQTQTQTQQQEHHHQHQHPQQQQQFPVSIPPPIPQNPAYLLPPYNIPQASNNSNMLPLSLSLPPPDLNLLPLPTSTGTFDPSWSQPHSQLQPQPQPGPSSYLLPQNADDPNLNPNLNPNANIGLLESSGGGGGAESQLDDVGLGGGGEMFWDLAGLDLDQIFAALLEGRDVSVVPS